MKFLVFNTWSSNENYNADCNHAVVPLTRQLAARLRKKMALARRLKKSDDVFSLAWWDYSPTFVSELDDEVAEALADRDHMVVDMCEPRADTVQRLDTCQLVVHDDGVYWQCIPKHTDVRVETRTLSASALKELS